MPRYDLMHSSQRVRDKQAQQRQASSAYQSLSDDPKAERPARPPRPEKPKSKPNPNADHVRRLCREGRLYELEKWVAGGGNLAMPPDYKKSPLRIAIDRGFHSLIEFLLRNGANQEAKDDVLQTALLEEQPSIATLALDCGADPKSVSFFDVLGANSLEIALLFLSKGADPITDYPFPRAFQAGIQSTLRTFLECRRLRPDLADAFQEHLDMALRQASSDCCERLAGMLVWAGANPRARGLTLEYTIGPIPNPEFVSEDQLQTTAIKEACFVDSVSMLQRFSVNAVDDDLTAILRDLGGEPKPELTLWLLKRGAKPNDKENGGSSALDRCLRFADQPDSYSFWRPPSKMDSHEITKALATFETLVAHGALWRPDSDGLRQTRRTFLRLTGEAAKQYLNTLKERQACDPETLKELTRTPAMQALLRSPRWQFAPPRVKVKTTRRIVPPRLPPQVPTSKYDREKLYEQVWSQPTQNVAAEYGVSDIAITKVCKRLRIPKPPRGYWNKKAAGLAVPKRPALPSPGGTS